MRGTIKNPADDLIKRAVQLSRQPGSGTRESGAGRGGVATNEDMTTAADDGGFTQHAFILDLDALDNNGAVL